MYLLGVRVQISSDLCVRFECSGMGFGCLSGVLWVLWCGFRVTVGCRLGALVWVSDDFGCGLHALVKVSGDFRVISV